MIDVSELITDPDFCQEFFVRRDNGHIDDVTAEWVPNYSVLTMTGVITPAKQDDILVPLPEGERSNTFIRVFCTERLIMGGEEDDFNADRIAWRGSAYKVIDSRPWGDFGYWEVVATQVREPVPAPAPAIGRVLLLGGGAPLLLGNGNYLALRQP